MRDWYFMNDITQGNGINTLVGKRKFKKGGFSVLYFLMCMCEQAERNITKLGS